MTTAATGAANDRGWTSRPATNGVASDAPNRGRQDALRCERKFALSRLDLPVALIHLQRHPLRLREIYAPRRVNSVYLDTPDWQSYLENRAGVPHRNKLRFRWYGELFGEALRLSLERKQRIGSVGAKRVGALGTVAFRAGQPFPYDELRNRVRESLPDPGSQLLVARCSPVLLVSYSRRYFLSYCGRVRLTLDWSLEYWRLSRLTPPTDSVGHPRAVIEMKYAPESEAVVREVTTSLPYRQSRLSKFVLGIRLTHL